MLVHADVQPLSAFAWAKNGSVRSIRSMVATRSRQLHSRGLVSIRIDRHKKARVFLFGLSSVVVLFLFLKHKQDFR